MCICYAYFYYSFIPHPQDANEHDGQQDGVEGVDVDEEYQEIIAEMCTLAEQDEPKTEETNGKAWMPFQSLLFSFFAVIYPDYKIIA